MPYDEDITSISIAFYVFFDFKEIIMEKKMIVLVVIAVVVIGFGMFGAKKLGLFYQKQSESALEMPQWREKIVVTNDHYVPYKDEYDIVKNTAQLGGAAAKYYSKYIDYIAPNGKPIRILAQNEVNDEQLLYAYSILNFYLYNLGDKVSDTMANNEAVLVMPNGADRDGKTPIAAMIGQNQNQAETANVGSKWYIENDYEHRDAAFEEIFHLVHGYGIGAYAKNIWTFKEEQGAPEVAQAIGRAQQNALPSDKSQWGKTGLWGYDSVKWLKELKQEGSLEHEYIVSVIDSYYGLWEAWTEGEGGMWGIYCAKTRDEIKEKDLMGYEALTSFLPPYINTFMRVDPNFEGTFEMARNEEKPYTFKSQYLQNIILTGNHDTNVIGNEADNIFMGNSGNNEIDGCLGENIVQFRGSFSEYDVKNQGEFLVITDNVAHRDGTLKLKNIQILRFIDQEIATNSL